MQTSEIVVNFGASVIALLGGGGVILVAICGFFSKFIADRTIEGHKASLNSELERLKSELIKEADLHRLKIRRAELLFDRELEAVSEFVNLYRWIMPSYNRPDMEWDDACEDVSNRFSKIEGKFDQYLTSHAHTLPKPLRDRLNACKSLATNNKFADYEIPDERQASATKKAAAGKLLDEMRELEADMFEIVRNETRI